MWIEKLPSSFLLAYSRILNRKVEKCIPFIYLHRHSSLLTSLIVQPNVIYSSVRAIGSIVTLGQHCQYRLAIHGINTASPLMTRSYAKRSSDGSKTKRKVVDPKARYGGLNPSSLKLGFEKIKELDDADERVKKIFSLEYADDSEIQAYRRSKLVEKIQKDPTDDSLAVRVARTTLTIRAAAKQFEDNKRDLSVKSLLLGSIGRRRKQLKNLRKTDYERFENLLVELGITYVIPPHVSDFKVHTKKYLQSLTVLQKAREHRMEALDKHFAEQREAKIREIAELKKELGVEFTEDEMKHSESETNEGS